MLIFKIVHRGEWREAERAGCYNGSAKDRADGFLHFSTAKQLPGTLQKYYASETDLVLVAVEDDTLGPSLKWEKSRGGDLFPHLYGPLAIAHMRWTAPINRDSSGAFLLPPDLGAEV